MNNYLCINKIDYQQSSNMNNRVQLQMEGWESISPFIEKHGLEDGLRKILARGYDDNFPFGPMVMRFLIDQIAQKSLSEKEVCKILLNPRGGNDDKSSLLYAITNEAAHDHAYRKDSIQSFIKLLNVLDANAQCSILDFVRYKMDDVSHGIFFEELKSGLQGIDVKSVSTGSELQMPKEIMQMEIKSQSSMDFFFEHHADKIVNGSISFKGNEIMMATSCAKYADKKGDAVWELLQCYPDVRKVAVTLAQMDNLGKLKALAKLLCQMDSVSENSKTFLRDRISTNYKNTGWIEGGISVPVRYTAVSSTLPKNYGSAPVGK